MLAQGPRPTAKELAYGAGVNTSARPSEMTKAGQVYRDQARRPFQGQPKANRLSGKGWSGG